MTGLSLSLLGPFSAYLDGRPLHKFRTNRVQALLVYLATESALGTRRHRREALMEMLWPGLPLKSAQVNLRQTVYQLRLAISEESGAGGDEPIPFVLSDRQSVQINRAYPLELDVARFLVALNGSSDRWPSAFDLYRGDFLPDFYLIDANPFEEWAATRRAAFRQQVLDALDKLADEALREGELETAERYGRRQLEIDKLRESAYRQLMVAYAWNGRQSDSLTLYQEWVRTVGGELGASPDEETTTLYDTIREGRLGTAPTKSSAPATDAIFPEIVEPAIPTSPYRGLYAFREEDAPFFFGREAYTEKLLDAVDKRIIVAVVGPSGSGKSSVLHAGLMANLRTAGGWATVTFRPGSDPFQALAAALHPWLEPEIHEAERLLETRRLSAALGEGTLPLDDVITRLIGKNPDADRVLLAADQFEELYTLCPEPDIRRRFLDILLAAVSAQALHREPAFTFVLTLRADFLGQALSYRPFADALQDADVKLGPMTREELARAIEQPARLHKVSFDEGLVDRIVDDVGSAPGNLPLLQFALAALWERQVRSRLTHASYDESGRVHGALALYADQIYGGLGSADQEAAQRLFVQLVRPGGRTEDTRRLASRTELGESDWTLAQRLADARLVVVDRDPSGQQTAELVHEALILRWQRLRWWIETDRAFRTWQERLRASIRQWETSQYDEGGLLRGVPLAEAEGWLNEREDRLSQNERDFIKASLVWRDRRQAEREAARAARERLRRRITLGLAAGLVVAVFLAALAIWQWNLAREAQTEAEAERDQTQAALSASLASQALLLVDNELDLSLLLAVEAVRRVDSNESQISLYKALTHSPEIDAYLHGHTDQARTVAFSPDGRHLATGSSDKSIRLWDLATGQPAGLPLTGHTDEVRSVAFSPDGSILASAGFDDTVILWETDTLTPQVPPLDEHSSNVWSLAFSPDGRILASGDSEGKIVLWDVVPGSASFGHPLRPPLIGHEGTVFSLAIDPDSRVLASAGADGLIRLWDVAADSTSFGRLMAPPLTGHESFVRSVAFSPDGQTLASGGVDKTIILWDVAAGSQSFGQPIGSPLTGHVDWVTSVAFSPSGEVLGSASRDHDIILWDIERFLNNPFTVDVPRSERLRAHGEAVWDVAFSADGRHFASAGGDNKIIIWSPGRTLPLVKSLEAHKSDMTGVAFSPNGEMLATSSADRTVILWDMADGSASFGQPLLPPLIGHTGAGPDVLVFSPDGQILASGGRDRAIIIWDVDRESPTFGQRLGAPLTEHGERILSLAFHPGSRVLASGHTQGLIVLWDVDEASTSFGRPLGPPLEGHADGVNSVAFHPSGDWLASGGADGKLMFWDISANLDSSDLDGGQTEKSDIINSASLVLSENTGDVQSMDYNPSGRVLATGGSDFDILLWDADPASASFGKLLGQPLAEHDSEVMDVQFSPDGRVLASLDATGLLFFWDVTGASPTVRYEMSTGGILGRFLRKDLAYSPDGRFVATSSDFDANDVLLWDVDVKSWRERACQRANRNLTPEEWQRFFGQEPYRPTCSSLLQ